MLCELTSKYQRWVVPNIFVKQKNDTNFKTAVVFQESHVAFSYLLKDFVVDKKSVSGKTRGLTPFRMKSLLLFLFSVV